MVCKYCQAELAPEATVCPACGADVTAQELPAEEQLEAIVSEEIPEEAASVEEIPEEAAPVEEMAEEVAAEEEQPSGKSLSTRIVAIVCSIVMVLGLGFGIWYGITGGFGGGFGKDDVMVKDCYAVDGTEALATADKVIAKVGDKTLTNRQLQVIYWMEVMNFVQQNQYYLAYFGLDPTQPLSGQYVTEDGLTWEQFFLDNALNNWHYYQCLVIEAEQDGYVLSETLEASIDNMFTTLQTSTLAYGYSTVDELLSHDMGAIVTAQAYRDYVELYYGGMEFFSDVYASVDPSREEVEHYYNVNGAEIEQTYGVNKQSGPLVDVRHILVSVKTSGTDESGAAVSTEEDWANCLADAEKILQTWKEGAANEDSFALLANTFSEDPGSNTGGGLYTYVYKGQMVAPFDEWCFDASRQVGDVGIVKTDFGYHIIYFVGGEEGWLRRSEQALIEATCTDILAGYMEEHPLLVRYKSIVLSTFSLF